MLANSTLATLRYAQTVCMTGAYPMSEFLKILAEL